ncbi:unnamed protein product [Dicrocoelium dendriticum]|nr:unnamed protein product [Dicrocoelium dendriticum]
MHPQRNAVTTSTSHESQASLPNAFNQSTTVTISSLHLNAMNLIPTASYPSIAMTGASVSGAVFASAIVPQQQHQQSQQHQTPNQPLVFSGGNGNFFLAQPASVAGTPVMLAPGQSASPGAFVVAQSLSAPATSIASTSTQQQASCIIRLPDGRLVMPAHTPMPMGLSGARLTGGQPAYFPVLQAAVPSGQNVSLPQQPQLHHPVGAIAPTPGQAFFIQVPTAPGGFTGTVFATTATRSSTTASPQAPQTASCAVTAPVQNRHPILVSSPLPTLQSTGVMSTQGANSVAHSRPPCLLISSAPICLPDTRTLQSQSKTCAMDNCVTLMNSAQPSTTAFSGGGIAVTRLPNGMYTTVPYCRPQSLGSVDAYTSSSGETFPATPPPHTTSVRKCSSGRSTQKPNSGPNSTSNVLQRLDEQITALQAVCNPSETQATRLKQLIDVRQQLSRTTKTEISGFRSPSTGSSSATTDVPSISPAARRDILGILGRNNLLPRVNSTTTSETFVVEFRLNQHRYQMRLTRQQKVDMERLLFSVNPERQAEILTVLQQEQARTNSTRVLLPNPSTPQPVIQSVGTVSSNSRPNLQSHTVRVPPHTQSCNSLPSHPIHPTAFGSPPTLRLVAPRPTLPSSNALVRSAPVTMCSTAPVMGVVTALTMPPMAAHSSVFPPTISGAVSVSNATLPPISGSAPTASGLFLSPSLPHGAQTFIMQQPFVVPSTSIPPAVLPVCCSVPSQSSSQLLDTSSTIPQSVHLSTSTLSVVQPVRQAFTPPKQALRLNRMRAYLVNDLKSSVERPPHLDIKSDAPAPLPSPLQLLEALAPYHVHQDADNTDEALLKVNRIIENASICLSERKRRITDAVHAYWYRESTLEPTLEDRVLVNRMMLELDRDVFEAEKKEFEEALKLSSPVGTVQTCEDLSNDTTISVPTTTSTNVIVNSPCQTVLSTSCEQKPTGPQRRSEVPYLKHACSSLPPPWSTLLGPVAYLRPRVFDAKGNASFSSFNFPVLSDGGLKPDDSDVSVSAAVKPDEDMSPSTGTYSTVINDSSNKFSILRPPSPNDLDVKEDSSEDAEADLFLGLGTRASRTCANECIMMDVTGLLEDGVVGAAGALRARTRSVAFDETYDLWQELMREEGIEMDEIKSMSLDISLDGSSALKDKNKASRQAMENGPNDQVVEIQHSEDPDLDAAIRSILSPSN